MARAVVRAGLIGAGMLGACVVLLAPLAGCARLDCSPPGFPGWTDPPHCKQWRLDEERRRLLV